jgi:hypothetical protein
LEKIECREAKYLNEAATINFVSEFYSWDICIIIGVMMQLDGHEQIGCPTGERLMLTLKPTLVCTGWIEEKA